MPCKPHPLVARPTACVRMCWSLLSLLGNWGHIKKRGFLGGCCRPSCSHTTPRPNSHTPPPSLSSVTLEAEAPTPQLRWLGPCYADPAAPRCHRSSHILALLPCHCPSYLPGSTHLPPQRGLSFPKASRPPSTDHCVWEPREGDPRDVAHLCDEDTGDKAAVSPKPN